MNSVEQIRWAMHAQPFRPFSLRLVDGTSFVVEHPDFIAVPPGRRPRDIACFTSSDNDSDEYVTHWIDLGLVLAVVIPGDVMSSPTAAPPAEGNGT